MHKELHPETSPICREKWNALPAKSVVRFTVFLQYVNNAVKFYRSGYFSDTVRKFLLHLRQVGVMSTTGCAFYMRIFVKNAMFGGNDLIQIEEQNYAADAMGMRICKSHIWKIKKNLQLSFGLQGVDCRRWKRWVSCKVKVELSLLTAGLGMISGRDKVANFWSMPILES